MKHRAREGCPSPRAAGWNGRPRECQVPGAATYATPWPALPHTLRAQPARRPTGSTRTARCSSATSTGATPSTARPPPGRAPGARALRAGRSRPLARQLPRRYERPEEPFDDLFQVACLGLVKAIDRFDLSRDVAFSSYAVPTMLGEIKRYFRDRTWALRVPRDLQELALHVDGAVTEL